MQRGLRAITLQGAIEESPILLSQYWKIEWLDGNIIISYFGGSNTIFADCIYLPIIYLSIHPSVDILNVDKSVPNWIIKKLKLKNDFSMFFLFLFFPLKRKT